MGQVPSGEAAVLLAALTRAEAERVRTIGGDGSGFADADADTDTDDRSLAAYPAGTEEGATQPPPVTGPPGDPGPALVAMALITFKTAAAPVMAPGAEVVFVHEAAPRADAADADGSAEHPCTTRVADGPALNEVSESIAHCTAHVRDVVVDHGAVLTYGRRQGFRFLRPDTGEVIPAAPSMAGSADELLLGRRIEPAVVAGQWDGTGLDLSLATSGLLTQWLQRHGSGKDAAA